MSAAEDLNPVVTRDGVTRDPLGVCGKCFAPILTELSAAADRERPPDISRGGPDRMVAPSRTAARDTNVSLNRELICEQAGVVPRKFHGYLRAEWATVSLRDADALLAAFGRNDLFATLTVLHRQHNVRLPLWRHACEILAPPAPFSSARRLAAVEPLPTTSAPAAEEPLAASTTTREAEAPTGTRRREAA